MKQISVKQENITNTTNTINNFIETSVLELAEKPELMSILEHIDKDDELYECMKQYHEINIYCMKTEMQNLMLTSNNLQGTDEDISSNIK